MTQSTNRLGRIGEELAARHLAALGYHIRERNWRGCEEAIRGEVDIIAEDASTVVFCEVKSRRWSVCDEAFAAVTYAKQRQIRRLAALYLAGNGRHADVRFDVVAVAWPAAGGDPLVHHIAGAF
ncbi:MAG: YraN family protein [Nitriliruptorales bacterium]|nr:YraN family protein [Nitriliruptorales bacterium]